MRASSSMVAALQPYTGVLFLALAAICWSMAGLFTRLIALDPWTILFWRGVFGALLTGACTLWLSGGDPAAILRFRRGHWSILFWMTLGTLAFIPALALTSVASVAIIYATTPLMVAGLSRIWLGERVRAVTVLAGLIATGGVAVMASDRGAEISTAGLVLAVAMAFSMAMTTVAFRKHPDAGCWPIGCLSNALTATVTALLAQPFAVTPVDLVYLLLFGLVQMTLGLGLFVMGTRRLAAADAAIIGLLEAPLAPLWVWLALDEVPSGRTMIGGALVLGAAAGHILAGRKRRADVRSQPPGDVVMTSGYVVKPPASLAPLLLSGLAAVAGRYDGYIIDLWGTVHDGVRAYPAAIDVLRRLRARGAPVCLLSNAARSAAAIAARLAGLGVDTGCYDHLVSSGEATIAAFRQPDAWHAAIGRTYYLIAPDDGELLLQDLGYTRVEDPSGAAFVLNTGSTPGTELAHYETALRACATRNLPMICANPDLVVKVADRRIMCAGTIARRYEALGGRVRYHGKPGRAIYQACLERMKRRPQAVLAIGDGVETDIAGACGMEMDSVFVLGGLHAESLSATGAAPARDQLQALFAHSGHAPTYVIPYLRW